MAVCWLGNAGIVASKVITTSLPILARLRRCPERNPAPGPTRTSSEPTPHAMPNMVRKVRSLLAIMARKTWPRVSENDCMKYRRLGLRTGAEERLVRGYEEWRAEVPLLEGLRDQGTRD